MSALHANSAVRDSARASGPQGGTDSYSAADLWPTRWRYMATVLPAVLTVCVTLATATTARAQSHDEHASMHKREQTHDHGHAQHAAGPVLPAITDEDRAAAFPDLAGHTAHDKMLHGFVLADQLEWQDADEGGALAWEVRGWYGGDVQRLWFRTEGEREDSRTEHAEAHLLWGRKFSPWWDVVAGVRQDFQASPAQTWAAFGVQGEAPYRFEVEATAYIGESGQTAARFEVEYELLLTNRLILQPLIELNAFGKDDARRAIGSGLSSAEAGFRLRYEIRRELAPYIGLTWERKLGHTADFAELEGESRGDTRLIAGLRAWF